MARYRATEAVFVDNRHIAAGGEFSSDEEIPGRTWEPLDDEAKERKDALPPERRSRNARFVAERRAAAEAKQQQRAERLAASKPKKLVGKADKKPAESVEPAAETSVKPGAKPGAKPSAA